MLSLKIVFSLAALLTLVGLLGLLLRKNLVIMLMSLEIMFLGAVVAFVGASRYHSSAVGLPDGVAAALLILVVGACEVCVGLTMIVQIFKGTGTVWVDELEKEEEE